MKAHRISRGLLAAALASLSVGCGNDTSSSGSGGAAGAAGSSTTGQAGSNAQGGTSGGGTANVTGGASSGSGGGAGGAAGSGGGGNASGGKGSCGPGAMVYKSSMGCLDSDLPTIPVGYTLTTPMTAGQTYAVGYGVNGSTNPKVEIWGTSEPCGAKLELLSSETRAEGYYCVELHPTAAHTSVYVSVSESASGARLLSVCPNSTCQ
jgi:hypothetical protein